MTDPSITADSTISDHGAKIAAGRLGIGVAEYRAREAAGQFWCGLCCQWVPRGQFVVMCKPRTGRCRPCFRDAAGIRYRAKHDESDLPMVERTRCWVLTPEGAAAMMPSAAAPEGRPDAEPVAYPDQLGSGHSSCPPSIRHICEGNLPAGWVRSSEVAE